MTFRALAVRQRETKERNLLSGEGPMLETLDCTIRIGSTPTFLYFDLYKLQSCESAQFLFQLQGIFFFNYVG